MDRHVKNLGNLSIALGIFGIVVPLLVLLVSGGPGQMYDSAEDRFYATLFLSSMTVHMLLGVPMIVVGLAVKKFQDWARLAMIVLCAVNLLNVPFGSLLGIYGLWVLLTPETEPLFLDPPRAPRAKMSRVARESSETEAPQLKRPAPDLSE